MPELLCIGMYDAHGQGMVNDLSKVMLDRQRPFTNGELVNLGGAYSVMILDASQEAKDEYTVQATAFFDGGAYDLMQVVLPDLNGKFPWDAGCAEPFSFVRVYGEVPRPPTVN